MHIQSISKDKVPDGKLVHIFYLGQAPRTKAFQQLHKIKESTWYIDLKSAAKSVVESKMYVDLTLLPNTYHLRAATIIFKTVYKLTSYAKGAQPVCLYFVDQFDNVSILKSLVIGSDLASAPANKMWPAKYCETVQDLFAKFPKVEVSWYDEHEMKKMGMNLVIAVGKGSNKPPRFLKIELKKSESLPTVCLVGKGVVFDSGGYNLKPGSSMTTMKGDKTGGSIVVAILHYFAKEKCPYNLVGIIPLVENLISHKAQKIGDVHTAFNGKTVEVLNTDAEGRLILADALAYASTLKPHTILDFATLTGWAQALHCDTSFVYFTTNDELSKRVDRAGNHAGERSIRLPNWPEYRRFTKSDIADYKNVGFECGKSDGFMATMFLMNFVKEKNRWVHFDITHSEKNNHHFTNAAATAINLISSSSL